MNDEQHDSVMDAGADLEEAKEHIEDAMDALNKAIRNFRAAGIDMDDRIRHNIINNLAACLGDGDLSNTVTVVDMIEEVDTITEG